MINFNGLATGLDTGALIDQLVAAEKSPASTLQTYKAALGRQATIVGDLSSKLGALADAARAMDLASEIRARAASTSDERVGVAVSGTAAVGTHTVRVGQLAAAQVAASRGFASDAAGVLGDGSVAITIGGVPKTVAWTAADSLSDIAARINANVPGASASVLNDGSSYRIVVASSATGTAGAASFADGGDSLLLADPGAIKSPAKDLQMTIDGVPITRSGNVVGDAIAGVTFTARSVHAVGDADTAIGVTPDDDAVVAKVQKLVDAYNAVAKLVDGQLRYDGEVKGIDTLFGDSTVRRLQSAAASTMTSAYGGKSLRDLGVKLGPTGTMTLDAGALKTALASDPDAVEDVFATGGLATAIATMADQYTRSGDGILAAKSVALTARQEVYAKQIERIEMGAEALGDQLREQFTKLERAVALMQGQSNYLLALTR